MSIMEQNIYDTFVTYDITRNFKRYVSGNAPQNRTNLSHARWKKKFRHIETKSAKF